MRFAPLTVGFLSLMGILDEVAYFPTLLLGHTFTVGELSMGALLASATVLVMVGLFLAQCKPLVDLFDRVPLYAVVALYATIMTISCIFSWNSGG